MSDNVWIILAAAVATFITRAGGFWVLSLFQTIHPRVEAGLNAVPAAVLTTLVVPQIVNGGVAEIASIAVAALVGIRTGMISGFFAGWATIVALRAIMG
jgi:uncharacterized membrane protein